MSISGQLVTTGLQLKVSCLDTRSARLMNILTGGEKGPTCIQVSDEVGYSYVYICQVYKLFVINFSPVVTILSEPTVVSVFTSS